MGTSQTQYDVAVIGAGAAGLACARALADENKKVIVLEGRNRIGGRILTHREATHGHAIELGAEFMHGKSPEMLKRILNLGLPFYDCSENHFFLQGKNLKLVGTFWEKMEKAMKSTSKDPSKDRSFAEFVNSKKTMDSETRRLLIAFVEGFHGADTTLASEVGIGMAEPSGDESLNGASNFKFIHGYDRLLLGFTQGISEEKFLIKLNTTAKKISWNSKSVSIECETAAGEAAPTIHAKTCVVSVPISILKSSPEKKASIKFEPEVPGLAKVLSGLEMGYAIRIVFFFRTRFWEDLTEKPIGFLHAGPEFSFPTWWTANPVRVPMMTAWQGGPKAHQLDTLKEEDRVNAALQTLSKLTGFKLSKIEDEVQSWHMHNWTDDPYSLGAYSYVKVGGVRGAKKFAKPLTSNLFFAGEATDSTANRGTVGGAIDSGLKVARQILNQ